MSDEVKYCKRGHPRTPENVNKQGACKLCVKILKKGEYERNKERYKECGKQYYISNKEKIREYNKKYREINKQKIKEIKHQNYEINKESIALATNIWKKNNPDIAREVCRKSSKKQTEKVSPHYVAGILKMPVKKLSLELYELKRNRILAIRAMRELKNALKG